MQPSAKFIWFIIGEFFLYKYLICQVKVTKILFKIIKRALGVRHFNLCVTEYIFQILQKYILTTDESEPLRILMRKTRKNDSQSVMFNFIHAEFSISCHRWEIWLFLLSSWSSYLIYFETRCTSSTRCKSFRSLPDNGEHNYVTRHYNDVI